VIDGRNSRRVPRLLVVGLVAVAATRVVARQTAGAVASDPTAAPVMSVAPRVASRDWKQIRTDQASVDDALAHMDREGALAAAVARAESIVTLRRRAQGAAWWETRDAELQLDDLRLLAAMSSSARGAVADLYRRRAAVIQEGRGESGRSPVEELRLIADGLREAFGAGHRRVGDALSELAFVQYSLGRYRDAESPLREALSVRERASGIDPRTAQSLNALGLLDTALGNYDAAERDYRRARTAYAALGADFSPSIALVESNLGALLLLVGRSDEAIPLYRSALARIPDLLDATLGLASAYASLASYDEALLAARRALALIEGQPEGRTTVQAANAVEVLAAIDRARGLFTDAEAKYREAIDIRKHAQGESHPDYLVSLGKLASLHTLMGNYDEAATLYSKVREGLATSLGTTQHLAYAVVLNEEALLMQSRKPPEYTTAAANYEQALQLLAGITGDHHPAYITALHNLASVYQATGPAGYGEAERRYLEAERILDENPTDRRSLQATLFNNLATLYASMRRYPDADRLATRALDIRRDVYGVAHPAYATSLETRASILAAIGKASEAVQLLLQSVEADWVHVTTNLPALSDDQKDRFLTQSSFKQGDRLWSLVFQQHQSALAGFQAALLRKHLLFEATRQENGAFRQAVASASAEWRDMLDERRRLVTQRANLQSNDVTHEGTLRIIKERIDDLEVKLRRASPEYARHARLHEVTSDDVVGALRPGEALIEYVRYQPFDFVSESWSEEWHVGALVAFPRPGQTIAIDLGEQQAIVDRIRELRAGMDRWIEDFKVGAAATEKRTQVFANLALDVEQLIWEPLSSALAGIRRVYIAPDAEIGLVPFEALTRPGESDQPQYLGEHIEFVYLPTGRDLGRLAITAGDHLSGKSAVLVGNPDFGKSSRGPVTRCRHAMPDWLQEGALRSMTDAAQTALTKSGWDVQTLLGSEATEEAVLQVAAPRILQFGTHGYYYECEDPAAKVNPLVRSTLMLAGANGDERVQGRIGDGVLTALEVSGMNLQGTELVNLTACLTGVGAVTPEGVAGLRQAFLWAGARSLTMSMWEIPVAESTKQIGEFYAALGAGQDEKRRYAAFRESQLAALKRAREERAGHPFFWASIVFVGDPSDLPPPSPAPSTTR
jgi:CHAT domain-containing protein/tetratricopeptide (TPR) repeat protein